MEAINNERLIQLVQERPAIWNMKCAEYADRQKRREAWEEITKSFLNESAVTEEKKNMGT